MREVGATMRRFRGGGGGGGGVPQKMFKFGGSETLLSAVVMRYGSKKLTSNMKMADDCKSLYNQNN